MTALVLPALLRAQSESGDFGGPLSTALGSTALLDLGDTGPHRRGARLAVLRSLHPRAGRPAADLLVRGIESPAVTTALSMAWLARDAHLTGGRDG